MGPVFDDCGNFLSEWDGIGAAINESSIPAFGEVGVGYAGEWLTSDIAAGGGGVGIRDGGVGGEGGGDLIIGCLTTDQYIFGE